ncbi:FtsW/RodA/SpoVE family cell cycle protein [soil metagenome]
MTPLLRKFLGINWILFATMMGLLIFGVFAIYSASEFRADAGMALLWKRQISLIAIGLVVFFGAALIDYRWMRWGSIPFYLGALALLIAVQFEGVEVHSSKSWLKLGPLQFQPSQVAIAAGIVAIAFVLAELHKHVPIFRYHFLRLILAGILAAGPLALVLEEGDFGSASVWLPVLGAMLLVGSIPFRYLIVIALVAISVLPIAYNFGLKDYQKARIQVFMDLWAGKPINTQDEGYAINNILMAVGSAGWEGKGFLGKNVKDQKTVNRMGFIPKDTAINDFIFTVVAEEQGFRGSMLLISGFAFLLLQLVFVAFSSRDQLGRLLVAGTGALLFAHIFQNIGMNINLLPITGIPLPFISYGGTFVVINMFLLGVAQSVWIHRNTPAPEKERQPSL